MLNGFTTKRSCSACSAADRHALVLPAHTPAAAACQGHFKTGARLKGRCLEGADCMLDGGSGSEQGCLRPVRQ